MGQVYEAYDPRLKRSVAVKLLSRGTPEDVRRFVREAQAQAAQTHPDICPVHEAGETGGTPYIVMRLIEGVPLDEATAEWPLESKLRILCRIAEAVHAAHRTGLVHRDLKPGNLLVEPSEDGEPKPWVLDFGLARSVADGTVTADGQALGTPGYMAPEQARGEGRALDRRTDVYALGATLYHLLAGEPPFCGPGLAALQAVVTQDPRPLRPFGVPADVEAVVFKCLEKEPEHRYRSARALAEDLRRYLDDVPVTARPVSSWYRFRKWGRRNKALLRLSTVFTALLLAALVWGSVTAWKARERERLARRFTEQVEEMEALARYSHMAPLHDLRDDRELLQRRMAALREEMEKSGARAAGHYALGRGFLALEAPEAAYRELEAAWQAGYREPEVAAALALALSALYRDGLAAAELLGDWESRERRLLQLEESYGGPARSFLAQSSEGETPASMSQPYLAALLPFHAGRFEEALALLVDSEGRRPWSYELDALEGDIRRSLAIRHHAEDEAELAIEELERALAAYERAASIAPSDPAVARASSQVAVLYAAWEVLTGEDLGPVLESGLQSVRRALAAYPDDARSWLWKARLERLAAQGLRVRSGTPPHVWTRLESLLTGPRHSWRTLPRLTWS